MALELSFYYREDCHLCDAMRKALVKFKQKNPLLFDWHEIDIDRDIGLIRQYDALVPVLCLDGREICHYFFDEKALLGVLTRPWS